METGNAVDWFVDRHARQGAGDRLAFQDPWRTLTYAGLEDATRRFAGALATAGIERERRLVLLLQDTIDFPVAFWGALRAGVIPVPINTLLTPDTVRYILSDSRAVGAVVSEPLVKGLGEVLAGLRHIIVSRPAGDSGSGLSAFLARGDPATPTVDAMGDEVAFWLYSSGSTGAPKGVKHLHASLRVTAQTYGAGVLGIQADDVMFSAAKAFHAYGLGNSLTFPQSVGASSVFLPDRPTPEAVLGVMERANPTLFGGVPTLYAALLANPFIRPGAGSSRLRCCISAGEALPEDIGLRWKSLVGADILDGIGSTEMLHIFISNRHDDVRYGSSGKPVPGYEAMILGEHDRPVPNGEPGELVVRGESAAEGYWNQRDKTRRTFRGSWTYTGDTYIRDAEGYYRFQGRSDEMLKVGGVWVSPFEVEEALIAHPAVLEAAVIGRQDRDGLVKPKAFVILTETAQDQDVSELLPALQRHVKDRIGVWKYPRWIEVVDQLPKTATGKIQRFRLREV
ncbi:MAG TPA: benzoate-CoA ligase family protein [Rhodopila sp.]|uniref:benzoate-CoA ligase family protein n=1 Tax=Rhodopila sp. TaxID=2480087 RepID=UPI002D1AD679|nr:benzoate-CoA ligase family protein [Rhodopila sp.]HVY14047.1 benzoate-CoA ligase family protein [Rhodopila sp.]